MTAPAPAPVDGRRWFLHASGAVSWRHVDGAAGAVAAPAGAREIGAEHARRLLAHIADANTRAAAERAEQAFRQIAGDYAALIELGVPERLAARLTGHSPAVPAGPALPGGGGE